MVFDAMILHLQGYTGPGTTWTNEKNFVMNYAFGAGLITRPVDQQSSALTTVPQMIPKLAVRINRLKYTN